MRTLSSFLRLGLPSILAASIGVSAFFVTGAARADDPAAASDVPPPPNEMPAPPRDPDRPYRHGFTLELGIGLAMTDVPSSFDPSATSEKVGLAPLSFGIGGFLNEDVALMFRAAGTSYFADTGGGHTTQIQNAFYGPVVQWWASDSVFVRGGVGLGVYGTNPLTKSNVEFRETGVAFDAGVGLSFFNSRHHSLRIAFDLYPAYYASVPTVTTAGNVMLVSTNASPSSDPSNGGGVLGGAINFEWQYF